MTGESYFQVNFEIPKDVHKFKIDFVYLKPLGAGGISNIHNSSNSASSSNNSNNHDMVFTKNNLLQRKSNDNILNAPPKNQPTAKNECAKSNSLGNNNNNNGNRPWMEQILHSCKYNIGEGFLF